jgi:hypothetical protein
VLMNMLAAPTLPDWVLVAWKSTAYSWFIHAGRILKISKNNNLQHGKYVH